MHFKVEMRWIHAVVCPDRSDLLTSAHPFAFMYDDPVKMAVEGIGKVQLSLLNPGMTDNDDISPVCMNVTSQNDHTVSYRIDGALESLGASAIGDPILP